MPEGSRSPTKGLHEIPLVPKEEDSAHVPFTSSVHAGGQEDATGISSSAVDRMEDQRIHKRMVEFVKKRVVLLEKALNAEYHQESMVGKKF